MGGEHVDELETHGFYIETRVLAQVQQDLKSLSLQEMCSEIRRTRTVIIFLLV